MTDGEKRIIGGAPHLFNTNSEDPVIRDASRQRELLLRQQRAAEASANAGLVQRQVEKQREQRPAATKLLVQAESDKRRIGASPESVWGDYPARRCAEFIDRMRVRGFPGATQMKSKDWGNRWKTKGYGVGVIGGGEARSNGLGQNVFLCEDGMLRVYAIKDFVEHIRAREFQPHPYAPDSSSPMVIASLPLNAKGEPIVPSIGSFIGTYVPGIVTEVSHYDHESGTRFPSAEFTPERINVHFQEASIDAVLASHSTATH